MGLHDITSVRQLNLGWQTSVGHLPPSSSALVESGEDRPRGEGAADTGPVAVEFVVPDGPVNLHVRPAEGTSADRFPKTSVSSTAVGDRG
jgi:hypothetical protein